MYYKKIVFFFHTILSYLNIRLILKKKDSFRNGFKLGVVEKKMGTEIARF